jgi:hypothetical protein
MNISGKFLKVFEVKVNDKGYTSVTLSEGEKQKDGTYKNHFWNNIRFAGDCTSKVTGLEKGDVIEIVSGKITPYKSDKGNYFLNTVVFDFNVTKKAVPVQAVEEEDDDLPY